MGSGSIRSAGELRARVDEFIARCEAGEIDKPSDYRLCEFLGVSPGALERWSGGDGSGGYAEALKKLTLYREHYWLRAADDYKRQTFAALALKQPKNGGWDRQPAKAAAGDLRLEVTVNGAKDAFG